MAFGITLTERISMGNKLLWKAKIQGDGSDTTVSVPLTTVDCWWAYNIDDTSAIPAISGSGTTLTYAAAPTSTKYHWLYAIGSD
jgi:hypothetical protein